MTAQGRLQRATEHVWAVLLGYAWRQCASCGQWWGDQRQPTTDHFASIPGGEDDHRLICPACTDAGVGCKAHAETWHHDDCEFVDDAELWPTDDTDDDTGRSGPYLLPADGVKPSPYPRKEPVQPIKAKLPEPKAVTQLNSRAAQRRIREAGERARVLAAHRDMLASIPDIDNNDALRTLLSEHAPVFVEAEDRLVCKGCAPAEPYTPQSEENYPARQANAPCPTWSTIYRLHRRSA